MPDRVSYDRALQRIPMATIYELLEDPTDGLLAYIDNKHTADFNNLKIRPYGFQAPGLLDPDKYASGYQLRGMTGYNRNDEPVVVPVLLGKIAPIPNPIDTSRKDAFNLMHQVADTIVEWQDCVAVGINEWASVNFEISSEQSRNVASARSQAWYWVMRWQFDLKGWFDIP